MDGFRGQVEAESKEPFIHRSSGMVESGPKRGNAMIDLLGGGRVRFTFEQPVDSPVFLVGDFNNWEENTHPLQYRGDGKHIIDVRLEPGQYEFKYKSGSLWFNDSCAHQYVPNCWGSENSVVVVPTAACRESRDARTSKRRLRSHRHSGPAIQPSF